MTIKELKPNKVWEYFDAICKIPHISHHTEKLVQYLTNEFKALGYNPIVDKAGNIFVAKPAHADYQQLPVLLLQAHSDMVGTKDPSSKHDFLKDPIQTRVENGWVYANKTTLGADNGIAVAMIMAVFADRSLKHGPLEALITADEETGMEGIQKFDIRKIKAKYLINMDNENDEEICIGCPGNVNIEAELFFKRETRKIPNTTNLKITVTGGVGGHSGQTIAQKRINAIKKIFNTLNFIVDVTDIRLIDIEKAGVARNVIPFECTANINVYKKDVAKVKKIVAHSLRMTHLEYDLEKDMDITCSSSDTKLLPMRKNDSNLVIGVYAGVPNGISTINWKYNVPETSSNLGLIETKKNSVWSYYMVRSSYDQAQLRLANRIKMLFKSVGGTAKQVDFISGWLPKENELANIYQKFYKGIFKKDAKQVLINGGVEPAFILAKKPNMLGMSIGPLMEEVHTKSERLNIKSTQKIYDLLLRFLPTIK